MNLNKLPLNNLVRNSGRTAGLVVLVALLAFVVYGGSLVMSSLQNGIASLEARLGADVIVAPMTARSHNDLSEILVEGVPGQFYMDASLLDEVAEREGVEVASPQYFLATVKAGCCSMPVQIIGFDPETDFTVQPWIARSYGGELGLDQVVVGCNIEGAVGATIQLYGVKCDIVSKLDETGTKLDNAVFATSDTVQHLINAAIEKGFPPDSHEDPATMISTVQVKVADGYDAEAVAGDINIHVRGVYAEPTRAMTSSVAESVSGISGVVGVLMGVIWVLAAAVLVIAFTVVGKQRAKEFAVLRVLGASRSALSGVVVKEAAFISVLGAIIGVVVALLVVLAFNGALEDALGVPFLMPEIGSMALFAVLALVITLVAGCAASALSAHRLSKVDAGQVLREE
ncbi:MAG: FtsX-like permease family protein [Eggerthellaceae bacterium]|nr:FtsX-like permease family protein [Eggerthellaceae bacterium]